MRVFVIFVFYVNILYCLLWCFFGVLFLFFGFLSVVVILYVITVFIVSNTYIW